MAVYHNNNGDLELIAGSTNYQFCPIGTILPFGGSTAPNGFFLCQGQAISRTEYKELFAVIGTSFGSGNGSTTFNIPDLRGEFLRGAGTNSHTGEGNGGAVGVHQGATVHKPGAWMPTNGDPNIYAQAKAGASWTPEKVDTFENAQRYSSLGTITMTSEASSVFSVFSYTAHPTNTSVNYIIKAKVVGDESDDLTVVNAVQDGNMNPVTSNAVFDKLNTIAVGTVTGQASGTANVVRVGRLAVVTFNNVTLTSTRKMNIQEGFRPLGQAFFVPITGAGAQPVTSLQFDPNGVITQNGTEDNLYGTFTYVCEA